MDYSRIPKLDNCDEKKLWDNALIVFDTSAICALYNLTLHYRQVVITILKYLHNRIWIPYQVLSEYKKNRKKAICNPITEKYAKLSSIIENKFVQEVRKQIEIWGQNVYFHPYIDSDKLALIKTEVESANSHIRVIKETIDNQYEKRKKEIKAIVDNDELSDFVDSIDTGSELSFKQIYEIILEGDYRYRHQIPPGYEDSKGKEGMQKFGDLIIWKEIIKQAQTTQKDIIFICNDFQKGDWYIPKSNTPRIELISEFQESSNKKIWFYTIEGFISKLQEYFKSATPMLPLYDQLEEVAVVLHRIVEEKKKGNIAMILRCNKCNEEILIWSNELHLEWESNGSFERGMGPETEWFANIYATCKHCKQQVEVVISAYEYPMGAYNYGDIYCDSAELISDFDIETYAPIGDYDENLDTCLMCGELAELNDDGLCIDCSK